MCVNIPLLYGFSPQRWWFVLDIMIEKTPKFPSVDRLRIIKLIEADFKYCLKILSF